MATFDDLVNQIDNNLDNQRDRGTAFEKMVVAYLKNEPTYKPKIKNKDGKRIKDKSTIIFNKDITISGIPKKAYQYIINGNSAIEWIMDQYQIHKTDKEHREAKIIDDPNDYSDDPKYIFNLLLRIITVSLKTIELINQLPKFEIENDN